MKTLRNNLVAVGTLAVSAALFATCLLFTACQKGEAPEPAPAPDPTTPGATDRPDPVADLVAYFVSEKQVLLVEPGFEEQVLLEIGAQPGSDGRFKAIGNDLDGRPVTIQFTIALLEQPMKPLLNTVSTEPATPDLVHHFTKDGTDFRLFKNAECGKEEAGFEGSCTELPDGSSTKNVWYAMTRCGRGNTLCTEVKGLSGRKVTYLNGGCQGAVTKEEPILGWRCK